ALRRARSADLRTSCASDSLSFPRSLPSFFFNAPATTEIYTLSLHDALPICLEALELGLRLGTVAVYAVGGEGADEGLRSCLARGDRKSTRLNSSHVAISYAVFCLKKKKKKHTQPHAHIIYQPTHPTHMYSYT